MKITLITNLNAVLNAISKPVLTRALLLPGMAAAMGAAQAAPPDVVFLDGGYAEICSTAAHNAGTPGRVELTGSRLETSPIELCTLAIRYDKSAPHLAGSYNNRGVLLFAEGALEAALSDFDAALERDPLLAQAHINRGYTLVALQRWEASISAFDRGLELGTSEQARAHFNRGIAHEELGHVREAYQDYLLAAELDPLWEDPRRELTRFTVRGE